MELALEDSAPGAMKDLILNQGFFLGKMLSEDEEEKVARLGKGKSKVEMARRQ